MLPITCRNEKLGKPQIAIISLSTVCKSTCVCRCAQLYTIKCPAHPFCKHSPPSLPPVSVPVDRERYWFTTEDAIIQTSRRPIKQHYLIAACKQTQLHSQQTLQPLSSPSLPPLSSSSHSISYRTTLLSSLLLHVHLYYVLDSII